MLINNTIRTRHQHYPPTAAKRAALLIPPEATERVVEGELLRERPSGDQEWFSQASRRVTIEAAASPAACQAIHAYLDHAGDDEEYAGFSARFVDYYV